MVPRVPSPAQLAALRTTFAAHSPTTRADLAAAAAVARCTVAQASKAWSAGWSDAGIAPLETELGGDVRAAVVATVKAETIARAAIERAHYLGAAVAKLAPAFNRLCERMQTLSITDAGPGVVLRAIKMLVSVQRDVGAIERSAVELSRLVDGEATSIIAHVAAPVGPVDLNAARDELAAAARAVDRATKIRDASDTGPTDGHVH